MSKPSDKPSAPKPAFTSKAKLLAAPYKHTNGAIVHYHDGAHAFNAQCRYVGPAIEAAPVPTAPATEPKPKQAPSGAAK